MRRISFIKIIITIVVISTAGFYFCDKNKNSPTPSYASAQQRLQENPWQISDYRVNGTDFTGTFNGYTLSFDKTGKITAISGDDSRGGSWVIGTGTGTGTSKLSMNFGNDPRFGSLNNDWQVVGESPGLMQLTWTGDNSVIHSMELRNVNFGGTATGGWNQAGGSSGANTGNYGGPK